MPPPRTRSGYTRHEPYPLNNFPDEVIHKICERIVYLQAGGHADMEGNVWSRIFAESIGGESLDKPLGVADVTWNGCCWSAKTVKQSKPFDAKSVRLISGRNSPTYSSDIENLFEDVQATGNSVLEIYNNRIQEVHSEHKDVRLVVLIRNMDTQEYTLYERPLAPFSTVDYTWKLNKRKNFIGKDKQRHAFTWQYHGGQFTIIDEVPSGAKKFRIANHPKTLEMDMVLQEVGFEPDWIEIL